MEPQPLNLINPAVLQLSAHQLELLAPYLVVFGGLCLAVLVSVLPALQPKWSVPGLTFLTYIAGAACSVCLTSRPPETLFGGMLISDPLSLYANALFLVTAAVVTLFSFRYLENQSLQYSEYYLLLGLSALGMMFMASSLNLIMVFIALEMMSITAYVLVGFRRNDRRSNEAGVKYYILGSAASAVLLYGAALLYGATLSVDVREIAQRVAEGGQVLSPLFVIGLLCVLVGFLFKIASVPFHMWMPDVYEGAPTPVTGFMTTGLKAAVFITLVRVVGSLTSTPALSAQVVASFQPIFWVSALATMFIGNVIALQQNNLKRMLAYSSIAHTGYLLLGFVAAPVNADALGAVLFYVMVYAIMNLGAFAVLSTLSARADSGLELDDVAGLAHKHPWLALALSVFLFSMAGLPPTAGFTSKYFLFYSAVLAGNVWLVVLAVLCSAIAAYYYLRVIVAMYMREPAPTAQGTYTIQASKGTVIAVALMLVLVFKLGLLPSPALNMVTGLVKPAPSATADIR